MVASGVSAAVDHATYTFGVDESVVTYEVVPTQVAVMGLSEEGFSEFLSEAASTSGIYELKVISEYYGEGVSSSVIAFQSEDYPAAFAAFVALADERGGFVSPALIANGRNSYAYASPSLLLGLPYTLADDVRAALLDAIPGKTSVRLLSSASGADQDSREQGLRLDEFFPDTDLASEEPENAWDIYLIGLSTADGFEVLEQAVALAAQEGVLYAEPDMLLVGYTSETGRATVPNLLFWDYNTDALGNGWLSDKTFGVFYADSAPWYFHETHGWLYLPQGGHYDDCWFYDHASASFYWTQLVPATYPHILREDGVWFYYLIGSENPRWFYNYSTEAWENF